jgi:nickel transport protein
MGRLAASALAIALASVLVAAPAFAHKLKVFATVIDGHVDGTVYFVGGAAAAGAVVTVETGDGRPVATVVTDGDGRFRFTRKLRADLLIVADSGDGHMARVTIPAEQLGGGLPSSPAAEAATTERATADAAEGPRADAAPAEEPPADAQADAQAIEALVEMAVARQIIPLREQLNAYEDRVQWRDVLGGLGYILGLAGLAAWLTTRRKRDRAT